MPLKFLGNTILHINAGLLFSVLAFFLIALPWLESSPIGIWLLVVGHTVIFIAGLLANRERPIIFRIGIGVVTVTVIVSWLDRIIPSKTLDVLSALMGAFVLATTAILILCTVFEHVSRLSAILRALCVYLLIGLAWAKLYQTVEQLNEDSFSYPESIADPTIGTHVYFSFVTMSTLGYGDIHPNTPVAQMLTWVQSIIGQFYLAVLVARLVNMLPDQTLHPKRKNLESSSKEADQDS